LTLLNNDFPSLKSPGRFNKMPDFAFGCKPLWRKLAGAGASVQQDGRVESVNSVGTAVVARLQYVAVVGQRIENALENVGGIGRRVGRRRSGRAAKFRSRVLPERRDKIGSGLVGVIEAEEERRTLPTEFRAGQWHREGDSGRPQLRRNPAQQIRLIRPTEDDLGEGAPD
jgi:hypothetical protein